MKHNRLEENRKILELLRVLVEQAPDLRFGQILINYVIPKDCKDYFYTEGDVFIHEMYNTLKSWNVK